ncbi:phosphatidate cytidylyltransferase [Thermophilibacter provencensis]|uniref:Phosphatidate cytidylyltransferase n=1 Tax=Thermophilibacter provencensis TaxID=1852386 RepID=A0ABT7V2Y8_9ACTN|nr:phosphatidate cytidylyltransferase [Thermophilibacter provencensis]MDM8270959.1 phosphatidate cytidylyltransferase [Thermophilibacter provencensis]
MTQRRPQIADGKARGDGLDRPIDLLETRRASKEDKRAAGDLTGQKARSSAERLLTRTTSGAIYAIVTLVCLFVGPLTTTVLISAEAWLCCSEFFRICRMGGRMPNETIGLAAALLFPVAAYANGLLALTLVIFVLLMACACWYVFTPRASVADVAVTAFGPLYTSLAFSSIVLVRVYDAGVPGALLTLGIMFSIWGNDAMAYFVGSAIGSHKLAPRISPSKSVEGFFGGIVGSVIVWVVLAVFLVPNLDVALAVACGLVVGFAGVIGDLFESRIKRGVGVKDSGNLIPGHGGLLDRSDSMLFGGMAAYFLLLFGGIL